MALGRDAVLATVVVAHASFWAAVIARLAVRRRHRAAAGAFTEIVPGRAKLALGLSGVTMGIFYVELGLWWKDPDLTGPALFESPLWLQAVAVALLASGIGLVAWAYAVFDSFRLVAAVDSTTRLCVRGPFAVLRHPIYTGVNLLYVGSFVLLPRVGFLAQAVANALAYDYRGRIEEDVLATALGDEYRRHKRRTFRLLPKVY